MSRLPNRTDLDFLGDQKLPTSLKAVFGVFAAIWVTVVALVIAAMVAGVVILFQVAF